jgi:hypothetical protein
MAEREMKGGGHGQSIPASHLPDKQKEQLHRMLQFELTSALINEIKANPPTVDLAKVSVVIPAGESASSLDLGRLMGDCGTCGTCSTCGTSSGIRQTVIEVRAVR